MLACTYICICICMQEFMQCIQKHILESPSLFHSKWGSLIQFTVLSKFSKGNLDYFNYEHTSDLLHPTKNPNDRNTTIPTNSHAHTYTSANISCLDDNPTTSHTSPGHNLPEWSIYQALMSSQLEQSRQLMLDLERTANWTRKLHFY